MPEQAPNNEQSAMRADPGSSRRAQGPAGPFDRAALIARWVENFGFDLRSNVEVALAEQEADHVAGLIAAAVEATRRAQATAIDPERMAKLFHNTYERLAPEHGYETREASRKPWSEVPENNRALMVAVCAQLLDWLGRGASGGRPAVADVHAQEYADPIRLLWEAVQRAFAPYVEQMRRFAAALNEFEAVRPVDLRPVDLWFGIRPKMVTPPARPAEGALTSAGQEAQARHASPNCACGVNDAGQRYVDPICQRLDQHGQGQA